MSEDLKEARPERFELREELGRGAVGVVWRAFDQDLGQEVALKLLLRQGDAVQAQRFLREGQLAAGIRHPGICPLLAAGRWRGQPFLAYELIAGAKTLHDVFPLARVRRRIELVRDVAEALGAAHARGVVHRDVKPANVLVDLAGQIRVSDFGAAAGESLEALTQTGTLVGTPAYLAPEQMCGDREAIGPQTDVWALGVMLYECLTEASPFQAETLVGFMQLVQSAEFTPVRKLAPDTHPEIAAICQRALSLSPEDRFPDAGELARALGAYLGGEAEAPPTARGGLLLGGAAVLAFVLAAAALALGGRPPSSPPASLAEIEGTESPSASANASPSASLPASTPSGPDAALLLARAKDGDPTAALALGESLWRAGATHEEAEHWLKQAAQGGLPEAWELLGRLALERGEGRAALQAWERAEQAGSETAAARIGRVYASGLGGVTRDAREALRSFQRGAEAGDPQAQERLGQAYARGRGVARDPAQARLWLTRAARAGHPAAMCQLGVMEEFGQGAEGPDLPAALRWYRAAAAAGDGRAQTNLGYLYETGKGVPVRHAEAVHYYRQAAKQGEARALFRLGACAERGKGLPQSAAQAANYYERALEAGSRNAALALGKLVDESDPAAARRWYLRATELGSGEAWFQLGLLHEQGQGGPKDLARAAACYAKGSEVGDLSSTTALGVCYEWGYGVSADPAEAFRLFRQAAESGHPRGMAWLGLLYQKGKGTPQDRDAALRWFQRGAKAGDSKAKTLLEKERARRAQAGQ